MKVRALVTGTHYLIDDQTHLPLKSDQWGRVAEVRHRDGDVFELKPYFITVTNPKTSKPEFDENGRPKMRLLSIEEQFSPQTMQRVDDDEPESYSTAQEAINRQHDELLGGRVVLKKKTRIAEAHS